MECPVFDPIEVAAWHQTNQLDPRRNNGRAGGIGPNATAHRAERTATSPTTYDPPHPLRLLANPNQTARAAHTPLPPTDGSSKPADQIPIPAPGQSLPNTDNRPHRRDHPATQATPAFAAADRRDGTNNRRRRCPRPPVRNSRDPNSTIPTIPPDTTPDKPEAARPGTRRSPNATRHAGPGEIL